VRKKSVDFLNTVLTEHPLTHWRPKYHGLLYFPRICFTQRGASFFFAPFPTHQQRLQGHFTNISTSPQKRAHRLIIEKLHSRGKWKVKKRGKSQTDQA
jgi:hypothetical protein